MRRVCLFRAAMVSLTMVIMASAWARAEAAPKTSSPEVPSYQARYLVQITWQPEYLPFGDEVLYALLESSTVQSKPLTDVLGIAYDGKMPEGVAIDASYLGPVRDIADTRVSILLFEAEVDPDFGEDIKPAAAEYLRRVCAELREALLELSEQSLRPLHMKLAVLQEEVDLARDRVSELQQKDEALHAQAGQQDLDRDAVMARLKDVRDEQGMLRMELAMQNARRIAVEEQIAEITDKTAKLAETDPVLEELRRVVEIRRGQMDRIQTMSENGVAPADEVAEYKERLVMAEMQLAERRQQLPATIGEGVAAELNKQLYQINIEEAERAARLDALEAQLAETAPLLALANVYGREVRDQLSMARRDLERAQREMSELQRMLRLVIPPEVTIIGDEGGKPERQ